jgi:hypothetical protein
VGVGQHHVVSRSGCPDYAFVLVILGEADALRPVLLLDVAKQADLWRRSGSALNSPAIDRWPMIHTAAWLPG